MKKTIVGLLDELKSGATTAEALAKAALESAKANAADNAFVSLDEEGALEAARAIDAKRAAGEPLGALAGIPLAVKDNILAKGLRCTCGSKILGNFVAPYDATATERLRAAGAVIVGKANMDEFAMGSTSETSASGPVTNPEWPELIPGGSSGGSAAAVARGTVPAALGSDTGGSIRQPAACCGVVGFKPSYGRVSRWGLVAYASSLDQIGPMANTVEDAALLYDVIAGHDPRDATSATRPSPATLPELEKGDAKVRIGVPRECFGEGLDAGMRDVLQKALDDLKADGAELVDVSLPSLQHAIASYYIIATAEASANLSRFDGVRYGHRSPEANDLESLYRKSRSEGFGKEVQRRILLGTFVLSSGYYDAFYMQAQKVRRLIADDFAKAFAACDVVATPVLPGPPLKRGEGLKDPLAMYLTDIFTVSLNLAGLPGISVPVGSCGGSSASLQLVAPAFEETRLLQSARRLERLRR